MNAAPKLSLLASIFLALGTVARAESYRILEGTISSAEVGGSRTLSGSLEAFPSVVSPGSPPDRRVLLVGGFALEAGGRHFAPDPPVEFDGLDPTAITGLAAAITIQGDAVRFAQLLAGGELLAASGDERTFRLLDFRAGSFGPGGLAVGRLGNGPLPRRLQLEGTLLEVVQTFQVRRIPCGITPIPPGPPFVFPPPPPGGGGGGGGIIAIGRSGTVGSFGSFHIAPTLEELGITAPAGAVVRYDETTGDLEVTSEGDLLVEGTAIDLPGLTRVSFRTTSNIAITGNLSVPPGVVLELEGGGSISVDGNVDAPGGIVTPPPDGVSSFSCARLSPVGPADVREIGSFSFVASAARQIGVDLKLPRGRNMVLPGNPRRVPVAILGSDALDIRDVDERSLRLGPDEAPPAPSWRGRGGIRRGHANRDRHPDLIAHFDLRDAGLAFGDDELCLVAETRDGETLEGCAAIQTLPTSPRRTLRGRLGRR